MRHRETTRSAAGCRWQGGAPRRAGGQMSASDLAIVAALVFMWAALSARL
jgi:hypothetical protein